MMKLVKKWTAVVLSITMVLGTMTVNPARAENDSAEVPEEEFYAAGAYPTDMSKISDDMKIDTLEEYYDVIAEEEQFNMLSDDGESGLQEELPDSVDLSTSEYFPAIGNQMQYGSCVAFAQVYYQFTYEMNRKRNVRSEGKNTFSPIFLYNFIANNNGSDGTTPETIYLLLQSKGAALWSGRNSSYNVKTWFPTKEIWEDADNYRIKKYYFISENLGNSGSVISSPKDSDLDIIKSALNRGEIICTSTYAKSWEKAYIGENSPYAGELIVTDVDGFDGPHRLTIVGYDDNIWVDINGDGEVQEAEKGAFKIANSWGEEWGNCGYIWFSYDAVNIKSEVTGKAHVTFPAISKSCGLNEFTRITVADYNSDSDIKLVYTLNTDSRKELKISVTAINHETGEVYTKEATPYYISDGNSDSRNLSFDGTEGAADGTMSMDLDTVVPGLTSETFDNYAWNVVFTELINDTYRTVLKDVKIVDYNTEEVYEFSTLFPQTINDSEIILEYNPNAQGYDLEIMDISYINLDTGEKNGRIKSGNRIQFESEIKNSGDSNIKSNSKISVLFTANQKTVWNNDVLSGTGININKSFFIRSVSGEDSGVITFDEAGTYSVTAWTNYNNELAGECGGNAADNNKKTITIEVFPEEEGIKIDSFTASDTNPCVGDTVTFNVSLKNENEVQTKIDISDPKGMYLYRSDYVDGTQISYQFNTNGSYYVVATVKDIITGEEVRADQYVFISVRNKEIGYDFEVSSLTYYWTDTGITNKKVYVGDAIRLSARVKNVGEVNAPDNQTMRISFQIGDNQENKVWNEEYTGKAGLAAGAGITLRAKSGGQQGNGNYIFDEPGTYTITAWVNDTNELSGEAGGNTAANNKKTITIQVYDKESVTNIDDFEVDETDVLQGDTVNFAVPSFHASGAPMIRLDIYTDDGALYDRIAYHYGFDENYCFEQIGTYYVQAFMVDTGSGERGITSKIMVTVSAADGYDLAVRTIGYQNTGTNELNGEVRVGETIKLYAYIENAGTQAVNESGFLIVKFRIQGKDTDITVCCDNNFSGTNMYAGYVKVFQSNIGGENDTGSYTFDKAGTYTITVSVNDDNTFPNEICGNTAKNNKSSITINVKEPSSINIKSFTADKTEIVQGEAINFLIDWKPSHMSYNRYEIYKEDGTLYDESGNRYGLSRNIVFEEPGIYDVMAVIEDLITGEIKETEKIRITVIRTDGYDLAVTGLSYINVDTGQIDGGLKAGDRIKLRAKIENKGNTKAPDNTLMKVIYKADNGKQVTTLYNDQFKNRSGLAAGGSFRLNSNKGGADDDGIYTLTENGTYTFTASVNDDNAFPDEVCGNGAKNNQRTITVRVAEPEKKIRLNSFEASAEEVFEGETVDFYAEVYNANTLKTKLHIYGMNGVIYHGNYVLGEQADYQFEQEGTYYIQATIVDPVTGEEVNTGFITVVVKRRED